MQIPAAIAIARRAIGLGVETVDLDQRARRGERVAAARADADDAVLGFEHVAGAGQDQRHVLVGDRHHRFEPAQIAVGAPVLGELDAGAGQLAGILFELGFEPLEQRERVGGRAGEPGDAPHCRRRAGAPCARWT